jgi:hypothetical protein
VAPERLVPNRVLERAEQRRLVAHEIVARLEILDRWAVFGAPTLVGAVAYGLLVAPDIDVEIYCAEPTVEAGFAVMREIAPLPGVWRVRFSNELDAPDQGLYWQIRYRLEPADDPWKLDMWLLAHDHPGPKAIEIVEEMRRALTDETRAAILEIKEAVVRSGVRSIDVYRAVLDDGVRTPGEFLVWHERNASTGLLDWHPRERGGADG